MWIGKSFKSNSNRNFSIVKKIPSSFHRDNRLQRNDPGTITGKKKPNKTKSKPRRTAAKPAEVNLPEKNKPGLTPGQSPGPGFRPGAAVNLPVTIPEEIKTMNTIQNTVMKKEKHFLRKLGVYGFDHVEPVILASLISEDPLLLIGKAGTGKTYLLNRISESLKLEHRHYNASFLSFDDLVGFPYPDSEGREISFLKTPATIWGAESVLIDEISRCKPETQNKFFSIIHEKKIQGIDLPELRYRWAAMNPIVSDASETEDVYEGSISLDQALADRFAFIVEVPDWAGLTAEEQEMVIFPAGEGCISDSSKELVQLVSSLRMRFLEQIQYPPKEIISYCRIISTLLGEAGLRISPRRARLLARNFTALLLVAEALAYPVNESGRKKLYELGLTWSIPQRAWKHTVPLHLISAAHSECLRLVFTQDPKERWLREFLMIPSINSKITMLMEDDIDMEIKSLAVLQFIRQDSITRVGIFAFAVQPLIEESGILDEESLNELSEIAIKIMKVNGELEWRERYNQNSQHPSWAKCVHYLDTIPDALKMRKTRAKQLFLYLVCNKVQIIEPELAEHELIACFESIQKFLLQKLLWNEGISRKISENGGYIPVK
jgi:MoxR-like ATPase